MNPEIRLGSAVPLSEIRKILILTESRSGSSFLGLALNSYPGTFYSFEPLNFLEEKNTLKKRTLLRHILTCSLGPKDKGFLQRMQKGDSPFASRNYRYRKSCVDIVKTEEKESLLLPESEKKKIGRNSLCYNLPFFNEVSIIH